MIWHPLAIVTLVLDGLSAVCIGFAFAGALQIAADWRPMSADRRQIDLEIKAESASILIRWGCVVFLISTLLFVIGIAGVFPPLVPGAMCGTGVLQAAGSLGREAVLLRGAALIGLWVLWVLEKTGRRLPEMPASPYHSRWLLLVTPIFILAVSGTFRFFYHMDVQEPVNCCALVYEPLNAAPGIAWYPSINRVAYLVMFTITGIAMFVLNFKTWSTGANGQRRVICFQVTATVLWTPFAYQTMITFFAPYYFQVLQHHCVWCLFLSDNYRIGFPITGALLFVLSEAAATGVLYHMAKSYPALICPAEKRIRRAAGRIIVAGAVFIVLAVLPAIIWRLNYGVWMG